jgi:hypothetical protein
MEGPPVVGVETADSSAKKKKTRSPMKARPSSSSNAKTSLNNIFKDYTF